ncbi:MAG: hypothetical protein HY920_00040 [Elusimicrobia bacterium]|nr:hypothetical protein [Elusimicrobiota bacterium]
MNTNLFVCLAPQRGFATVALLGILFMIFFTGATVVFLGQNESQKSIKSRRSNEGLFIADAGVEKAIWEFVQSDSYGGENNTALGNGVFNVSVTNLGNSRYELLSTGWINASNVQVTKKIKAVVEKDPVSQVFDYCYFINNWGWYWGHDITACGDIRSNGRFDFVDGPKVEGDIYAGEEIDDHGTPIRGIGGEAGHQHEFAEKVPMPNLQILDYYEQKAFVSSGTVVINGATMIDKVFGDDAGESGNIVLVGTSANPIQIDGTVVVRGDLVIKGKITGQGTIYAGRNIYVADNLEYKNCPNSPRPALGQTKDQWVEAQHDKDLVAYAAKGSIILGDYTKDPHYGYTGSDRWYSNQYLFSMGDEDVGLDGIPDTGDTGENDGFWDPAYEDIDGDGVHDNNYNWSDVETQVPITNFANVPTGTTNFSNLASNSPSKIEGIYYTNHAWAGRTGNAVQFNGSVISKDEAIIYRNGLTFNYDERAHSRYNSDPSRFIDLGLPRVRGVYLVSWQQVH